MMAVAERFDDLRVTADVANWRGRSGRYYVLTPLPIDRFALTGSDLILHAGDVGKPTILDVLGQIAPVLAVRGNIDAGAWAERLPLTSRIEAGPLRIYMLHDVKTLDIDPAAEGFHMVISGHSHKPGHVARNGVVYLNPGSAGPRRFKLPCTVVRIDLRQPQWKIEFIELVSEWM